MESEKKRKRGDHGGSGERRRTKEVEDQVAQPSEDEVEEFFTILRRMHVAVKYFEKAGSNINEVNGDGGKATELVEDGVDGVKIGGKRERVVENGGLDLNVVPEAES